MTSKDNYFGSFPFLQSDIINELDFGLIPSPGNIPRLGTTYDILVCTCTLYMYMQVFISSTPFFLVNSIALVKPEKAEMVERMLIRMAQTGQIHGKVRTKHFT